MQAEPRQGQDLRGSEGKDCWAAALAVARVSLEISGGGQSSTQRGSGGGRKMPGGCAGLCSEFPSQPSRGARKGGRREGCAAAPGPGGMLREASERPRGEDRGEKGAEKGRTGGLRLRRAGPGGGEAAAALKARYQWVSLQDKQRPDPGAAGPCWGRVPAAPG